jgi:hypothetical protein
VAARIAVRIDSDPATPDMRQFDVSKTDAAEHEDSRRVVKCQAPTVSADSDFGRIDDAQHAHRRSGGVDGIAAVEEYVAGRFARFAAPTGDGLALSSLRLLDPWRNC